MEVGTVTLTRRHSIGMFFMCFFSFPYKTPRNRPGCAHLHLHHSWRPLDLQWLKAALSGLISIRCRLFFLYKNICVSPAPTRAQWGHILHELQRRKDSPASQNILRHFEKHDRHFSYFRCLFPFFLVFFCFLEGSSCFFVFFYASGLFPPTSSDILVILCASLCIPLHDVEYNMPTHTYVFSMLFMM